MPTDQEKERYGEEEREGEGGGQKSQDRDDFAFHFTRVSALLVSGGSVWRGDSSLAIALKKSE